MFNQKKLMRFMFIASLTLGYLYLEKLKNEADGENA